SQFEFRLSTHCGSPKWAIGCCGEQESVTVQFDLHLIRGLEEELFKQSVRGSPEVVGNLLADSFVEFGRSGAIYAKEEAVRSLAAESSESQEMLTARDFVLRPLADDVVLLTYRSFRLVQGKEDCHTLRSSIWKFINGRWQMVFHQGTPTDR